ncbi:uncharacterized protein CIMG_11504 [Coccidioides immitis RS]|uniref:Uncharacterized protein n=3 Tax=Coccidioides TaxID=5500 RepID=A0A0D8JY02_COCIM|nr:uncharacterized protein CIMG_11504 [Coccidioides immitis RS]EFW17615.1 hypothetical protein CPSG_06058 [Coccidioides posadasii str. Silveira]KJF61133.1 hypothetical protein CIMG_11504 [Coccidioides immitis RS]KMM70743.1 hypothetical protein CPAG_07054 [Coccidioides posadasii RMSCC 3488]
MSDSRMVPEGLHLSCVPQNLEGRYGVRSSLSSNLEVFFFGNKHTGPPMTSAPC